MDTLAKQLVSGLSDDPSIATLEFRDRVRALVSSGKRSSGDYLQIISIAAAFKKSYGDQIKWSPPIYAGNTSVSDRLDTLLKSLDQFEVSLRVVTAAREAAEILELEGQVKRAETFGIAILDSLDKDQIRHHIENIRRIISEENLPDRKKAALLSRLASLELELETIGTRTDRFFAFVGDAGFVLGDFATKAKPFAEEVRSLLKIVLNGREKTEGVRLPRGEEAILLPPPDDEND